MGVIVIRLRAHYSAGEINASTCKCGPTNMKILNKLWKIPGFLWMWIQKTGGSIWDSWDVHQQWITLQVYDPWNIVHYIFEIILILGNIFLDVVFIALQLYIVKEKASNSKMKPDVPQQQPDYAIDWNQSTSKSTSSTTSLYSSEPTQAETHTLSTVQRSWRHSFYFLIMYIW